MTITFDSSALDSATYDNTTLTLKFVSGDIYSYSNVPSNIFEGLRSADSAGKYFRNNIINSYVGEKIDTTVN